MGTLDAERRALIPACLRKRRHARLPAGALLVALCAGTLAGCANPGGVPAPRARSPVHLPDQALLSPQPSPRCEFKTEPGPGQADAGAERAKLDYERQCYRHAELIVRGRLEELQASVGETVRSVKISEKRAKGN